MRRKSITRRGLIGLAWSLHNLIIHPVAEIITIISILQYPFQWLGMLARWIHDVSSPPE
jgi:hypothetical protein